MEIEIILLKNQITKMIWKIKLAHQKDDGSYDIPKKYLETLETLSNTVKTLNTLFDMVVKLQDQLSSERIKYLKSKREIIELKNTVAEMTKQVRL